jgi:hypothetical protein
MNEAEREHFRELLCDRNHFREMWKTEVTNGQRLTLEYQQARDRAEKAEADVQALSFLQSRTCEMVREVEAQRDALRAAARTLLSNPGVTKCPGGAELKAALEEGA